MEILQTTHTQIVSVKMTNTPFSHSVFMCSPNDFILGLPFTVAMMSQTSVKAFASHVFFKHA